MSLDLISVPVCPLTRDDAAPVAPLSLQDVDLELDTPADVYRSGNSVYTCLAMSTFSVGC